MLLLLGKKNKMIQDKIPDYSQVICNQRKRHNWKLFMTTYTWEYWACQDCPKAKKVRRKK